jgi:hypothetical protein
MAKTDFTFWGSSNGSNNSNYPMTQFIYDMHQGIGASSGSGSVAQGNPITNSTLSNALSNTVGGTHCRAWSWEDSGNTSSNGQSDRASYGWGGMLTSAAGGSLYPVTDTPANGTLVAQSIRTFLRIQSHTVGANQRQGCNIGFTFKGRSSQSYSAHGVHGCDPNYGYHVSLGTLKVNGDTDGSNISDPNYGTNAVPRICISANKQSSSSANAEFIFKTASGTYAFDTWYHVRADLIPSVGEDTVKVYTASITDTLGSETWSEVASVVIPAGHPSYVPWDDSNNKYVGYWVTLAQRGNKTTYGRHVPMMDKFQFLSTDIS